MELVGEDYQYNIHSHRLWIITILILTYQNVDIIFVVQIPFSILKLQTLGFDRDAVKLNETNVNRLSIRKR